MTKVSQNFDIQSSEYNKLEAGQKLSGDGEKHQNYVLSSVFPKMDGYGSEIDKALADLDQGIAQAKTEGDTASLEELQNAKRELQEVWRDVQSNPPGMHRDPAQYKASWNKRFAEVEGALDRATLAVVSQSSNSPSSGVSPDGEPSSVEGSSGNSSSSTAPAELSSDQMAAKMEEYKSAIGENPQAAMEILESIPASQRESFTMALQDNLQRANRMWSMMSNFQQAAHQTQKAILNNFRV